MSEVHRDGFLRRWTSVIRLEEVSRQNWFQNASSLVENRFSLALYLANDICLDPILK